MRSCLIVFVLILAGATSVSGQPTLTDVRFEDNGDQDGFLDTRETIELWLTLRNDTSVDTAGNTLVLSTDSPWVECIGVSTIPVGLIPANSSVEVGPFRWTMSALDRVSEGLTPDDRLFVEFKLQTLTATLQLFDFLPDSIRFQVDVDSVGGGTPTQFSEDFESATLGAFSEQNLDLGLNSNVAADGYRCQYNDPDNPSAIQPSQTICFFGGAPGADAVFNWQVDGATLPASQAVDGGRAFSGTHALYFGRLLDAARGHTTPIGVLEAVALTDPIHLGAQDVCSTTRSTTCFDDTDCPGGESCQRSAPRLTFKQQLSFLDERRIDMGPVDRGIVMAQLADDLGQPQGPWFRLEPIRAPYHDAPDSFPNCGFDPIDDGSTEDDLFADSVPGTFQLGPSSMCIPERVWSFVGDTDETPVQGGSSGKLSAPVLAGAYGTGSWVETEIDLSEFRGRSLRFRFIVSSIANGSNDVWDGTQVDNPSPVDDGWWIDDVRVTDTQIGPAMLVLDSNANDQLPGLGDNDADARIDACDNCSTTQNPDQADADLDQRGDVCDNCPADFNPDQADADLDSVGDACDVCPNGDAEDLDGDGVGCGVDNCRDDANASQLDSDLDGRGDACDVCPLDALDDVDGDGICGDVDTCPNRSNASQEGAVRLEFAGELANEVRFVAGGAFALFYADDEALPNPAQRLVSHPTAAGPPSTIGTGRAGWEVVRYAVGSTGAQDYVALVECSQADPNECELFGATVRGLGLRKLASFSAAVRALLLTSDQQTVIYAASSGSTYAVDVETSTQSLLVDDFISNGTNDGAARLSPDESWVVFEGQAPGSPPRGVYSVPTAGGLVQRINGVSATPVSIDFFSPLLISADSNYVLYLADELGANGSSRLFSTPIDGSGFAFEISGGTHPADAVTDEIALSDDGTRALFVLQRGDVSDGELRSAAVDGSGSAITLTSVVSGTDGFGQVGITPDGVWCVYTLGTTVATERDLYSALCVGSPPRLLSAGRTAGGSVGEFVILDDSSRILYSAPLAGSASNELYNVRPVGGPSTKISGPVVSGGNVKRLLLAPDGSNVIYTADDQIDETTRLLAVPPLGGGVRELSPPLATDEDVVTDDFGPPVLKVDPASQLVAFVLSSSTPEVGGTYLVRLAGDDLDADGVFDVCDTCPGLADPAQLDADGDGAGQLCDCDDGDDLVRPGGGELCDGVDSDCDNDLPVSESDGDGDGYVSCDEYVGSASGISGGSDCDDGAASTYPAAPEINDGLDNQCAGSPGAGLIDELESNATFSDAQTFNAVPQSGATLYEFAKAVNDPTFSGGAGCSLTSQAGASWLDPAQPAADQVFYYLARAAAPFVGSWGAASDGSPRTVICP